MIPALLRWFNFFRLFI